MGAGVTTVSALIVRCAQSLRIDPLYPVCPLQVRASPQKITSASWVFCSGAKTFFSPTYLMSERNIYGDLCAENGRTFLNSALASILRIGNCLREARRGPGPALDRNDKNAR